MTSDQPGSERRGSVFLPNGVRLHVVQHGPADGPAVLLLHGWPQTAYAWRRVSPLLASAGFRTIAPDLRGFGHSSKPAAGFDKKTVSADLPPLLDSLGVDRCWVVGHDMGGQVAYPFVAQWPDRAKGLVFIESGLPGFGQEAAMDVARGGSWHFGFNRTGDLAEALVAGREQLFIRFIMNRANVGLFDPTCVSEEDLAVYATAAAAPGALRCMFAYYQALLPTDRDDNLAFGSRPLTCPVLAVGAEHAAADNVLKTMQRVAESPVGWIVGHCGHYVPEERPRELADRLIAFFDGNR
ncbi:alpha/beta fold hydrolase [Azospirillum endophyticum]